MILYMVNQLLLPGHTALIAGFPGFRAALESVLGPLSTQALASQIYGLYAGLVYFTPLLGGLIADRWIGQRNAVVMGALLMSAGHFAMVFDQTFLVALLSLVIGSGLLKGNISAQVGALYPHDDEARRTRGFVIFSTGINVGAVAGPILCGLLAEFYGWHAGFGAAGVFMLAGLATYLAGYRYLPARVERGKQTHANLTARDWRIIGALLAVMTITVFQSIAYYQLGDALPLWIQDHVSASIGSFPIPIAWYQSIDSFVAILFVPPLLWAWRKQGRRGRAPGDLAKIGIGAALSSLSNLLLVAAIVLSGGARISPIWPFAYCVILGLAFLYYWPTLLALVSRAAPAKVNATMMGIAFMSLFLANILLGWIGGFYERMSPEQFWALHAIIGATGSVLVVLFGRRLARLLE
jgi:POT family proton-dependent oligopeptide transporter